MRTEKKQAFSLAGALCVISISLVAVLTVATASSVNQQLLQRNENTQVASDLADSAIQQAIAEIAHLPSWGTDRTGDQIKIDGPVEGSNVLVTFNDKLGLPYSTSNQVGSNPLSGWPAAKLIPDHKVPEKRIHLVAVARCRNVTRTKEALIFVPSYALSLAATGKVHLTNSIVGSLKDPADLDKVGTQPELLGPGDLATNSNLSDSVILESNSRVSGDLQSQGDVSLQSGSSVGGEVRRFHSTTPMPAFPFDDYDPKKDDALDFRSLPTGAYAGQKMTGLVRCDGTTVINGDLDLDNCLLFCVGDLKITGSLRGSGAVIVKRKTEIRGGGDLASQDNVALLSRSDVSLLGSAGKDYRFQGLIYTNGNFVANRFTVLGGFVADGGPGNGNVDLHDSKIYWNYDAINVSFFHPIQLVIQLPSDGSKPYEAPLAIEQALPTDKQNKLVIGQSPVRPLLPGQAPPVPDYPVNEAPVFDNPRKAVKFSPAPAGGEWKWWAPVTLEIQQEVVTAGSPAQLVYYMKYSDGGVEQVVRKLTREDMGQAIADLCQQKAPAYCDAINQGAGNAPTAWDEVPGYGLLQHETKAYKRAVYANMLKEWEEKNLLKESDDGSSNFSFDPNRFIKESEKIRLSAIVEY